MKWKHRTIYTKFRRLPVWSSVLRESGGRGVWPTSAWDSPPEWCRAVSLDETLVLPQASCCAFSEPLCLHLRSCSSHAQRHSHESIQSHDSCAYAEPQLQLLEQSSANGGGSGDRVRVGRASDRASARGRRARTWRAGRRPARATWGPRGSTPNWSTSRSLRRSDTRAECSALSPALIILHSSSTLKRIMRHLFSSRDVAL